MSMERPPRTLSADDDRHVADGRRTLLERWGHDVRVADDARIADVLTRVWRRLHVARQGA
jgi:CheY-like chemotaxis protein